MNLLQIECYLGKWDNVISLLASCLGILVNVILTICIFILGQRVIQDRDRQCFLSVIDEVGTQYEILKQLSKGFSEIQSNALDVIDRHDTKVFLKYLYRIKMQYATNWVSLPLHKFYIYQGLFDQYGSKCIKIFSHSKRIPVSELNQLIKETQNIFKECINQQNNIQQIIPHLNKFFRSDKIANKVINKIKDCNTIDSFCQFLSEYEIEGDVIDWNKARIIAQKLQYPVQEYQKCSENMREIVQVFCKKYNISMYYFHLEN